MGILEECSKTKFALASPCPVGEQDDEINFLYDIRSALHLALS